MNMLNLCIPHVFAYLGYLRVTKTNLSKQLLASAVPSRHHDTFSSALQQFLVFPNTRAKIFDTTGFCMVGRRAMGLTGGTSFPGPT